jgi:hypothetical protein
MVPTLRVLGGQTQDHPAQRWGGGGDARTVGVWWSIGGTDSPIDVKLGTARFQVEL